MIGRTGFIGDIVYSVGVSGFIYPIIGHWAWGPDGILATMGGQNTPTPAEPFTNLFHNFGMNFHDFAGSTVVHSIGGWIALAGGIMLGPRIGRKFKRDGGGPMLPHDLVVGVIGGFLLWFGWYGFNPGSSFARWISAASAASPPTPLWQHARVVWQPSSSCSSASRSGMPPP